MGIERIDPSIQRAATGPPKQPPVKKRSFSETIKRIFTGIADSLLSVITRLKKVSLKNAQEAGVKLQTGTSTKIQEPSPLVIEPKAPSNLSSPLYATTEWKPGTEGLKNVDDAVGRYKAETKRSTTDEAFHLMKLMQEIQAVGAEKSGPGRTLYTNAAHKLMQVQVSIDAEKTQEEKPIYTKKYEKHFDEEVDNKITGLVQHATPGFIKHVMAGLKHDQATDIYLKLRYPSESMKEKIKTFEEPVLASAKDAMENRLVDEHKEELNSTFRKRFDKLKLDPSALVDVYKSVGETGDSKTKIIFENIFEPIQGILHKMSKEITPSEDFSEEEIKMDPMHTSPETRQKCLAYLKTGASHDFFLIADGILKLMATKTVLKVVSNEKSRDIPVAVGLEGWCAIQAINMLDLGKNISENEDGSLNYHETNREEIKLTDMDDIEKIKGFTVNFAGEEWKVKKDKFSSDDNTRKIVLGLKGKPDKTIVVNFKEDTVVIDGTISYSANEIITIHWPEDSNDLSFSAKLPTLQKEIGNIKKELQKSLREKISDLLEVIPLFHQGEENESKDSILTKNDILNQFESTIKNTPLVSLNEILGHANNPKSFEKGLEGFKYVVEQDILKPGKLKLQALNDNKEKVKTKEGTDRKEALEKEESAKKAELQETQNRKRKLRVGWLNDQFNTLKPDKKHKVIITDYGLDKDTGKLNSLTFLRSGEKGRNGETKSVTFGKDFSIFKRSVFTLGKDRPTRLQYAMNKRKIKGKGIDKYMTKLIDDFGHLNV